jgi:23S rRNA (uracil1939-C5)-methyltransferase
VKHRRPPGRTSIELTIDALAAGGDGVGRDPDGRVTFVAHTAPGDRVRAVLAEQHRAWARADLAAVLTPSPARRTAPCAYFVDGRCGGCQWQHVAAEGQSAAKQAIVAGALRRQIASGLELLPIAVPAPPYHWRRRARLHWYRGPGEEAAMIGFLAPRSHRVVDIESCAQLEVGLERALLLLREQLAGSLQGRGAIALLAGEGGAVHVAIEPVEGGCTPEAAAALIGHAGIVGVAIAGQDLGAADVVLEQAGTWPELRGRADAFAQASRDGNHALLAAVDAAAQPRAGAAVLELYAGSGNFTRVLVRGAARVVAVDAVDVPWAFSDPAIERLVASAEEAMPMLAAEGRRFDLAVLDPPRSGAVAAVDGLAALGVTRVIYVSCDPATLGRDLGRLQATGFRLERAQAFDLMPQTAHVEVIAIASRDPLS